MQKIKDIMKENKGKLAYRTCFSSISYYGFKLDILKSGLQKYLRRKNLDKMLWCLGEIYLFKVYSENIQEQRAVKGIITNLLNRIIVMLDEELLFSEWDKYLSINKLIDDFEKSERTNFCCLVSICKILCSARLLRRNSDINAYFNYGMRRDIEPPKALKELKDGEDIDEWRLKNFKAYFRSEQVDERRNCFYWMYDIYLNKREGETKRFKRKENIYMVWEHLYKVAFGNSLLKKCLDYRIKEFYNKNKKERGIFLTAAIDLCLEKDNINWDSKLLERNPVSDESDIIKIFANRKKIKFDEYVIDMHTSLGRRLGKNSINFMNEGSLVMNEDKEYLVDEWRESYNIGKVFANAAKMSKKKKVAIKKVGEKKECEQKTKVVKKQKTQREIIRAEKYKRIKKIRGKPNFDDLEKNLEKISELDKEKIKLCSDTTCGNKVMCFEYGDKIWKESRLSMHYNRDYCVVDNCKELFGLRKIGMKRVLGCFRIEKKNKKIKSWKDNWEVIKAKDVVYCVMDKVNHVNYNVPMEISVIKHSFPICRRQLKEFVKIGVFRGIFRVSDFNCRNVLVGCDNACLQDYFVSIDEGDIGKRLDIIGGREKWLIKKLNEDNSVINEILSEINENKNERMKFIEKTMLKYKFTEELIEEVRNNWNNLKEDLIKEGIKF